VLESTCEKPGAVRALVNDVSSYVPSQGKKFDSNMRTAFAPPQNAAPAVTPRRPRRGRRARPGWRRRRAGEQPSDAVPLAGDSRDFQARQR